MARVTFKKGQRQEMHGTFCGLVYKQRNGQQYVYKLPLPVLPKKPTVEQQNKYIKDCVVQGCVSDIQRRLYEQGEQSVARMQEIADRYAAIKKAAERIYDDFKPFFKGKAINKLDKAIVFWFCYKELVPELDLFRDNLPDTYSNHGFLSDSDGGKSGEHRENVGTKSNH